MGRFDALTQLEDTPEKKAPLPATPHPTPKSPSVDRTRKKSQEKKPTAPPSQQHAGTTTPQHPDKTLDTSLLTTKEKTKYGTYLTDESIDKISIRAIQLKRDSHQIVQEAINQYFERLEK